MSSQNSIIRFHSQACISFDYHDQIILCDPWFDGDVFNRSWSLLKKPNLAHIDFSKLQHIWISHQHPDHLHFATLRKIRELTAPRLPTVYFRERHNKDVVQAISALGFPVVELREHERTHLYDDVWITSFPTGMDCAAVFEIGGECILNQNDCQLDAKQAGVLKKQYPSIDAWFFQFSLAGYYANSDDAQGLQEAKEKHLSLILKYYRAFMPKVYVPFASFIYFCKKGNAYLNDWRVTLSELHQRFPDMPIQVMYDGDEFLRENWKLRNEKNVVSWEQAMNTGLSVKDPISVSESDIEETAQHFFKQIRRFGPAFLRPAAVVLKLGDIHRYCILDFRRCSVRFFPHLGTAEIDIRRVSGVLNSEDFLFFLRFPWGADTLNVTASFKVLRPFQWWWMVYFRHALYRYHKQWRPYTIALPLGGAFLRRLKSHRGDELPEVDEYHREMGDES